MNIVVAILIFSCIIIVHELGHFLLAIKNGIFVTEFSVGMGPRLISLVKSEKGYRPRLFLNQHEFETNQDWKDSTKYSIKLLPLGGSCMMLGEDELCEDERAFNKKGVWARISVIFAGPLFNFMLAFILAMFVIGTLGYDPTTVSEVLPNSPAALAGMREGDIITSINDKKVSIARELDDYLNMNPIDSKDISITYVSDDKEKSAILTPVMVKNYLLGYRYLPDYNKVTITELMEGFPMEAAGIRLGDIITKIDGFAISNGNELYEYFKNNPLNGNSVAITYIRDGVENVVDVTPVLNSEDYSIGASISGVREKTNVLGIIKYSAIEVKYWIVSTIQGVGKMITGKVSADEIAGPVGIVSFIGDTYQGSKSGGVLSVFLSLSYITILLSANLGVMNLLPIPALDGGRLIFLLLEVLRGKPVDQNKEGLVHMIGLIALMILMVFVMFNDLSRLF